MRRQLLMLVLLFLWTLSPVSATYALCSDGDAGLYYQLGAYVSYGDSMDDQLREDDYCYSSDPDTPEDYCKGAGCYVVDWTCSGPGGNYRVGKNSISCDSLGYELRYG